MQSGNCCRVLGPRYHAKSKLMQAAAKTLLENGTHDTAYVSMWDLQLEDEATFFTSLQAQMFQELQHLASQPQPKIQSAADFQRELRQTAQLSNRNIALFIDDLEIAPPNLVASLLGVLRAVFTTLVDRAGTRFQAIICGTLSMNEVALHGASHFENVSDLVLVGELDEEERRLFAQDLCRRENLTPTHKGLTALFAQTGGDRYLIEQIIKISATQMKMRGFVRMTPKRVTDALAAFLVQAPEWALVDTLRQIESNPSLLTGTLKILQEGQVPIAQLPIDVSGSPNMLDLCGAFRAEKDIYEVKCRLWRMILLDHLTAKRIGGLYAIAGLWPEAINYLSQAILKGADNVKSELFTAVINAIYASNDTHVAFRYLTKGIKAVYPNSGLSLYICTATSLVCVYPKEKNGSISPIALNDAQSPEVEALDGPEYSISMVGLKTRVLIPLRAGSRDASTVGLVSLNDNLPYDSLYQQREEIKQLIRFLRQAAQAIKTKNQFSDLLDATQQRADKLRFLNQSLTQMLEAQEQPENTVLQMVLAGIISSHGLEFDRAILFVSNEPKQTLEGYLAAGSVGTEVDNENWQAFAQKPLNRLSDQLLPECNPLHELIEHMEISVAPATTDIVAETYRSCKAFISSRDRSNLKLPQSLHQIVKTPPVFALVPLSTGSQVLGVLYIDNALSKRRISDEQFELLQGFINQATLILEKMRVLATERQYKHVLTSLLAEEEKIQNKITTSMPRLLHQVVDSAYRLLDAACAVLYPLRPGTGTGRYVFDIREIAHAGFVREDFSLTDKPRSRGGLAASIITKGSIYIDDVAQAAFGPDGRALADSPFIKREGIQAFVGIRLGTIEEPVGVLYISWRAPHKTTANEKTIIEMFANFAAVAIPSARRYQQVEADLKRRTQELEGLIQNFTTSSELHSEIQIENMISLTLKTVKDYAEVSYVSLIRNAPQGKWERYWLTKEDALKKDKQSELGTGIVAQAFHKNSQQLIQNEEFIGRHRFSSRSGLAVPVKVTAKGNPLAILLLESSAAFGLTADHMAHIEYLASQLALNLEQAKLFQALSQLVNISEHLLQEETNLKGVLSYFVEQTMFALRAVDTLVLYYVDPTTGELELGAYAGVKEAKWLQHQETPRYDNKIINRVWKARVPIIAEDVSTHSLLNSTFSQREGIRSTAAFPLRVNDERVGCIFFGYRFSYTFDEVRKTTLDLFAQLAAIAIHRATLYEEAHQHRQRLETVAQITPIISASLDLDKVVRTILQQVNYTIPSTNNACVMQRDSKTQELIISPTSLEFYRVDNPPEEGPFRVKEGKRRGIVGRVIHFGESANVSNVLNDSDYIPFISSTCSELCVPIKIGVTIQSALVLESDKVNAFSTDDQRLLEMLADHVAIAIQNAQQYSELKAARKELQLAQERKLVEQTTMMATGLIHDIYSAVASIPDLVEEVKNKMQIAQDISAPLDDLRKHATKTGTVSQRLKEFVNPAQILKRPFEPEWVELKALIDKVLSEIKTEAEQDYKISSKIDKVGTKIWADPLWIALLLENLLKNAYDAIPINRRGLIRIEVQTGASELILRIHDNGQGISPEHLPYIFDFGFTTKDSNHMHGVGLAHCSHIVEQHSGTIGVEKSTVAIGSTFIVRLPINGEAKHDSTDILATDPFS